MYDEDGQLLTASLMDYLVPTAGRAADVRWSITWRSPLPTVRSALKAWARAARSARRARSPTPSTDALGMRVNALPLRPERVLELVAERARRLGSEPP